jgi:hypothetical protein
MLAKHGLLIISSLARSTIKAKLIGAFPFQFDKNSLLGEPNI